MKNFATAIFYFYRIKTLREDTHAKVNEICH